VALRVVTLIQEISLHAVERTIEGGCDCPLNMSLAVSMGGEHLFGEVAISPSLLEVGAAGRAHARTKIVLTDDGQAVSASSAKITWRSMNTASPLAR
jgi:hypothetical protein